jgi:hypothetical protein
VHAWLWPGASWHAKAASGCSTKARSTRSRVVRAGRRSSLPKCSTHRVVHSLIPPKEAAGSTHEVTVDRPDRAKSNEGASATLSALARDARDRRDCRPDSARHERYVGMCGSRPTARWIQRSRWRVLMHARGRRLRAPEPDGNDLRDAVGRLPLRRRRRGDRVRPGKERRRHDGQLLHRQAGLRRWKVGRMQGRLRRQPSVANRFRPEAHGARGDCERVRSKPLQPLLLRIHRLGERVGRTARPAPRCHRCRPDPAAWPLQRRRT